MFTVGSSDMPLPFEGLVLAQLNIDKAVEALDSGMDTPLSESSWHLSQAVDAAGEGDGDAAWWKAHAAEEQIHEFLRIWESEGLPRRIQRRVYGRLTAAIGDLDDWVAEVRALER